MEITYGLNSGFGTLKPVHILIWDFDGLKLSKAILSLQKVQKENYLPRIFVLKTSRNNHSALCLYYTSFGNAIRIIARTDGVDCDFLEQSIERKYLTLRIGPKNGFLPTLRRVIPSNQLDHVTIDQLTSWSIYVPHPEYYQGYEIRINNVGVIQLLQQELREILELEEVIA